MLTVDTIPLGRFPIAGCQLPIPANRDFTIKSAIGHWQSTILLSLFMASMLAATATELLKLQPVRCGFLVLGRCVVAALAIGALEHNVIARHNSSPLP